MPFLLLTGRGKQSRNDDGITRTEESRTYEGYPAVYVTPDISPQGLLSAYELLEVPNRQNVAIKLSDSDTETDAGFVWADWIDDLSQAFEKASILIPIVKLSKNCRPLLYIMHRVRGQDGHVLTPS